MGQGKLGPNCTTEPNFCYYYLKLLKKINIVYHCLWQKVQFYNNCRKNITTSVPN